MAFYHLRYFHIYWLCKRFTKGDYLEIGRLLEIYKGGQVRVIDVFFIYISRLNERNSSPLSIKDCERKIVD